MSWRDIARQAVQREAGGGVSDGAVMERPPASAEDLAEREAIAVVDGGLLPEWAAYLTAIESGPKPGGISERDWRARLDALWRRADEHGGAFAAHGWTVQEIFGVGEQWVRLDERGAAWLAPDARIVAIDSARIVFERQGRRTCHTKAEMH